MFSSVPIWIVVFFVGSLLHFTHPSKGHYKRFSVVDIFSSVNESVWEHMKLFIVAAFLTTLVYVIPSSSYIGDSLMASSICVLVSVTLIPLLYYGYKSFVINNVLLFDIGIFLLSCLLYSLLFKQMTPMGLHIPTITLFFLGVLSWALILFLVVYWTYKPPEHELFKCPVNDCFGHPEPDQDDEMAELERFTKDVLSPEEATQEEHEQ